MENKLCPKCEIMNLDLKGRFLECDECGYIEEVSYNRTSDPTLHHCQHKIADMNKYPYCPECGERV